MLEVDDDSRLGREMLAGGARYHAALVPSDDAIARMYEIAVEHLAKAGIQQYEISNFARRGYRSRHNLRYWERRPYLGLGVDASSTLRASETPDEKKAMGAYVLRFMMTDDLGEYLSGPQPAETAWLSPLRQHEEAWFLGLRLNAGVKLSALRREFGRAPVERAVAAVEHLAEEGLLTDDGKTVRLTEKGRLLSNEVFERFLGVADEPRAGEEEAVL